MSLIALLLLSSVSAYAEWVKIGSTDDYTYFADPSAIRRKGSLVKRWELYDFKTVQTLKRGSSFSFKQLMEYDCAEEQFRQIAIHAYSGQMGSGEIVESSSGDPGKWQPVIPGSMGQHDWT
jgi:hypothetical protein